MNHPDIDELTPTIAITAMLTAAETTTEARAVTRVGMRAGYLWGCVACREGNYLERETCHNCGAPRPAARPDDEG